MSKYTTEVRFICESIAGLDESEGYSKLDDILTEAAPKIFNFDFPIFDEAYRLPLEKKILKHFYTREISEETVGLWKLKLDDKMNVIMPYFNQLYTSELIKFNPLWDTDIRTSHVGTEDGEATNEHEYIQKTETNKTGSDILNDTFKNNDNETSGGTTSSEVNAVQNDSNNQSQNSTNTTIENNKTNTNENDVNTNVNKSTNYDLYSDTPQGALTGVDNETYLTNARKVNNDEDNISNSDRKGSTNQSGTSIGENSTDITSENERTANTQSEATNQEFRNRNQNNERNSIRQNVEDSSTDYTNRGTGGNRFNNTNEYLENVTGKRGYGSYSKMLIEFRDTFLNIDEMILNALEPLFFGLW